MLDRTHVALAEALLADRRHERNERVLAQLKRAEHEAAAKGTLGAGFYKRQQMDMCIVELRERALDIRVAYERVLDSARVPWTDQVREQVLDRIRSELTVDAAYLEERARNVIVQHGHGFEPFLADESRRVVDAAAAELDMLGLRRLRARSSLGALLQSARYDGPAAHWNAALECREHETPDHLGAAREAIHAVEGLARLVAGEHTATLGDCIKELQKRRMLHPGTIKQLEGLWGVSSAVQGLRHGAAVPTDMSDDELSHITDACEAVGMLLVRLDRGAT